MKRFLMASACAGAVATVVYAEVAPDDVAFGEYGQVEASLTGVPGDPAAGAEVLSNRGLGNCVACHQVSSLEAAFQGNVGPSLDGVADRWAEADLRGILVNAKMTFPDTIMPAFYKVSGFIRPGDAFTGKAAEGELSPLLTAQQIEDTIAYLMTLTE